MPKILSEQEKIFREFEKLFSNDQKQQKKILKEFENLYKIDQELSKKSITKHRKVISTLKQKKLKIKPFRQTQKTVKIPSYDLSYRAYQKDFLLNNPLKIEYSMIRSKQFYDFLIDNFFDKVFNFFMQKKFFSKKHRTLCTIGYHFYFFKNNQKTYQSGFRKPRTLITSSTAAKVIRELFRQTYNRFEVYFKTRNKAYLYFEGLTAEISYDIK